MSPRIRKGGYWQIPRIWPDSTVYIIGGGPSLRVMAGVPLTEPSREAIYPIIGNMLKPMLEGKRVIGVNNSFLLGDFVDVCWFSDGPWFSKWVRHLAKFGGLKIHCVGKHFPRPGTYRMWRGKQWGIESENNRISWNSSSGGSAINVAYHLGAKRIILLGFDMKQIGKINNFHSDHNDRMVGWAEETYPRFLKGFPAIKKDAAKLGLEILNATPDSVITEFPMVKLEDVI